MVVTFSKALRRTPVVPAMARRDAYYYSGVLLLISL